MSKRVYEDDEVDSGEYLLQKYTIVQFIKRGRPAAKRELDIVPTDWLYYNKHRDRCTVSFPDDLSNPEDQTFLHDLVRTCGDPPECWKVYTVDIRGRANTYQEALKMLALLSDVESVLTCSDTDVKDMKDQMIENIKRRKLQDQLSKLKDKLSSTNTSQVEEYAGPSKKLLNENDAKFNNPFVPHKSSLKTSSEATTSQLTNKNFDVEELEKEDSLLVKQTGDQSFDKANKDIQSALTELELPIINISNVVCNSEFETATMTHLTEINRKLNSISMRVDKLTNFVLDKQITLRVRNVDFLKKYKVKLPIEEQELFIQFDEQIKNDIYLERDIFVELNACIDKDLSISKSLLVMLRSFITKSVAVKYTASRKSMDKENPKAPFKFTNFYSCVQSVLISARNKKNLSTEPKEVIAALSNVLSNATAWDKTK